MSTRDLLTGVGIGAGIAFMLDPNGGARRRALVRDKVTRASRATRDNLGKTARDVANRTRGVAVTAQERFSKHEVSDAVLVERVRAKLGRVSSHPRAIDVFVQNGRVTLRGPIIAAEANPLVGLVATIGGVHEVVNELEPHETAEGVPSLQGHGNVVGPSIDLLQRRWAPATRAFVAAGVIGAGIWAAVAARRPTTSLRTQDRPAW